MSPDVTSVTTARGEAWRLLANVGWFAIPVRVDRRPDGTKDVRPLVRWGSFADGSWDEAALERAWAGHEDAPGLAVLTGVRAGIFAADADSPQAEERLLRDVPRSPSFRSRRGIKVILRYPSGGHVPHGAGVLGEHLDVISDGGLLVLPPTGGYDWLPSASAFDVPPAEAPGWILRALQERTRERREPVAVGGGPIQEGERNATLTRICGKLNRALGPEDAAQVLLSVNQFRCSPPLPEKEVLAIASSVARYTAEEVEQEETGPTPPPWPELEPEALHGLAGEVVSKIEPHTEADTAALLVDFLACFGSAAGSEAHAAAEGAEHPARIWPVTVGRTSKARKGSARRLIDRVFELVDPAWVDDRRILGLGSGEGLVADLAGEQADVRRLVVEEEFARILKVAERQGSTLTTTLRQAWDDVGRLGNRTKIDNLKVPRSHVSVIGHITLEELRASLTATELANGFANRFLFVLARRSKLLPEGGMVPERDLIYLADLVRAHLLEARQIRRRLRRTPDAAKVWEKLYRELAEDDPPGLLGAVTARAEAHVLRLSVAYALADGRTEIDVPHVRAAWALWQYCAASARYIFGEVLGDPKADALLAAITEAGPRGMTLTQQRDLFGGHVPGDELAAIRRRLEEPGKIVTVERATGGRPVRVSLLSVLSAQTRKGSSEG
jgi:hypothetical protein